ncbi:hypothetical protein AAEX63_02930 [Luteococcus sp. H138]|uniref:hypothetical protein n=1 Tax=unclassified Luteococcus TaxID=2639923 RepID=UPI00313B427D
MNKSGGITQSPWLFAALLMPIGIPLAVWGSWDAIQSVGSATFKILLTLAVAVGTYLGLVALLWWNRYMQRRSGRIS